MRARQHSLTTRRLRSRRDAVRSRARRGQQLSNIVGVEMMVGHPAYLTLSSYMHWTAPNSVSCANVARCDAATSSTLWRPSALMARPRRAAMHSGGVNVCFADGSVHFIKSSVALPTWWGLGTRAVR